MPDNPRATVWTPNEHPYLEVIDAPPLSYTGTLHLHEDFEIAWKPHASWNLTTRGVVHTITSDRVLITPPDTPHRPSSTEIGSSKYIGLRFQPEYVFRIAAEMSVGRHTFLASTVMAIEDEKFRAQLYRLYCGLLGNAVTRLQQDGLIHQFVIDMLCHLKQSFDLPDYGKETLIVRQVKSYIHDHYQEQISLEQLAHLANMSAFHLNRVFGLQAGIPPHGYQLQIRISRAKLLLRQGYSISDVALQTGFTSQSHFGIYFKRLVSVTPKQYQTARF